MCAANRDSMADGITDLGDIEKDVAKKFRSHRESNRFKIGWEGFKKPGAKELVQFMWNGSRATIPKKEVLDRTLPIIDKPSFDKLDSPESKDRVSVIWLGHACVLVQLDGVRILTDPVFSSKCGPSGIGLQIGVTRYRDAPCSIKDLPRIDAVVISHNHYDHLDYQSVCDLVKHSPDLMWFVPMGLKSLMHSFGCKKVTECYWWHWCKFKDVQFTFVPAQHWSKRKIGDDDMTLWGGWCVRSRSKNFFFAGDTGYNDGLFKEIGEKLGPFDLAAIPIGAYSPRWFMQCQHIDPEEALKIHEDIKAKRTIGIHWGTFNLSTEPYLEPREKIAELQNGRDSFFTINLGETKLV